MPQRRPLDPSLCSQSARPNFHRNATLRIHEPIHIKIQSRMFKCPRFASIGEIYIVETSEEFSAGVKQWMDQYSTEDRRNAKLKAFIRILGQWFGMICGIAALVWVFTGLPQWQLVAGFMTTIDSNWPLRIAYLAFGWPIVVFIGWAILLIPVTLLGMAWVFIGRIGLKQ